MQFTAARPPLGDSPFANRPQGLAAARSKAAWTGIAAAEEERSEGETMSFPVSVLDARILIVDDREADARLVESMLAGAGFSRVTSASDPFTVCELHREHRYDLVILDVLMPGMDGFEVMEGLKAIDPDGYLPVIVVTAEPDHMKRALDAGAKDFIGKPIRMIELLARVRNVLQIGLLLRSAKAHGRTLEGMLHERTADLRDAEGRFRALVEQSIAGIYIVEDGRYSYANPRLCELLGYTAEELRGIPTIDLVLDEDRERFVANRRRREAGDSTVFAATYRFRARDGRILHLNLSGKMLELKGRRVLFGIAQDVSAGVHAQELLLNANERLRILSRRVLAIQEDERRNISRELHDDVGQSLLALNIGLHRLEGHVDGAQRDLLAECVDVTNAVQEKLRELSVELHPPQLDQLGLQDALRWLVNRQRGMTGLAIECRFKDIEGASIPAAVASACYRICQEGLNNATRHSQARHIGIELRSREGSLELSISDDGVGFDELAKREGVSQLDSLGLISMEERARLAGGELQLHTAPGAGTRVIALFPLEAPEPGAVRARARASSA
jgi:PAS domain S-box-containing protein